jgi:hypothetical protein
MYSTKGDLGHHNSCGVVNMSEAQLCGFLAFLLLSMVGFWMDSRLDISPRMSEPNLLWLQLQEFWSKHWGYISGFGFFGFSTLGFTMIQVDEYFAAILSWAFACACLAGAALRASRRLIVAFGVAGSIVLFVVFAVWTVKKRADKPWSILAAPVPSFVFIKPAWEQKTHDVFLHVLHRGPSPITHIEVQMTDYITARVRDALREQTGTPLSYDAEPSFLKLFTIPEMHSPSLIPRTIPYRPLHPQKIELEFIITSDQGVNWEYLTGSRQDVQGPWSVFIRVIDLKRALYVIDCEDLGAQRPENIEVIRRSVPCGSETELEPITISTAPEPAWLTKFRRLHKY